MIALWIALGLLALVLLAAYISFRMAFYVPEKTKIRPECELPSGKIYEPFHPTMLKWMKEVRAMPSEDMCITTFDGKKLWGKYYEYAPDAPIDVQFDMLLLLLFRLQRQVSSIRPKSLDAFHKCYLQSYYPLLLR